MQVAFHERRFGLKHVVDLIHADRSLIAGRVGAVRVRSGRVDQCLISIYMPVRHSAQYKKVLCSQIVQEICKWLDKVLSKLPARCIPIIGIDLNDRVGKHRVGHKDFSNTCDQCSTIGPFAQDREGITAHTFRHIAMKHGLAFANTYHKSHATVYGPGYCSTIDFVLIPKTLLAEVSKCQASIVKPCSALPRRTLT